MKPEGETSGVRGNPSAGGERLSHGAAWQRPEDWASQNGTEAPRGNRTPAGLVMRSQTSKELTLRLRPDICKGSENHFRQNLMRHFLHNTEEDRNRGDKQALTGQGESLGAWRTGRIRTRLCGQRGRGGGRSEHPGS